MNFNFLRMPGEFMGFLPFTREEKSVTKEFNYKLLDAAMKTLKDGEKTSFSKKGDVLFIENEFNGGVKKYEVRPGSFGGLHCSDITETTPKEFDLKVGDRVRLSNGEEDFIDAVCGTILPYLLKNAYCWVATCNSYSPLIPHIVEKLEDEKPLEWVVGRFYVDRLGDKYKYIGTEGKYTIFWHVKLQISAQRYLNGTLDLTGTERLADIIGYWEGSKPKLHKKLEKKIRFNDNAPYMGRELDSILELNICPDRELREDVSSKAHYDQLWPRTATVKIEIIED